MNANQLFADGRVEQIREPVVIDRIDEARALEQRTVLVVGFDEDGDKGAYEAVAVDDVRLPTQFLHCLNHAFGKEDHTLVIVAEEVSLRIVENLFPFEIVLAVNEIDLHTDNLQRGHLDDEGAVYIINDDVLPRQSDYLV